MDESHLIQIEFLAKRVKELERQIDAYEACIDPMCYAGDRLLEHFDEEGHILGDGKWRQKAIWERAKAIDNATENLCIMIQKRDANS